MPAFVSLLDPETACWLYGLAKATGHDDLAEDYADVIRVMVCPDLDEEQF